MDGDKVIGFLCGSFGCLRVRDIFPERTGEMMYELDLTVLRLTLVKGVRMVVAVRRLAKDVGLDGPELGALEREVRERAGEVQEAEELMGKGEPVVLRRT